MVFCNKDNHENHTLNLVVSQKECLAGGLMCCLNSILTVMMMMMIPIGQLLFLLFGWLVFFNPVERQL